MGVGVGGGLSQLSENRAGCSQPTCESCDPLRCNVRVGIHGSLEELGFQTILMIVRANST